MANAQRILGPLLLILLVIGVVFAIYVSTTQQRTQRAAQLAASQVVVVTGLIGSEKKEYLTDPRVLDVLRRNGIDLHVETVGSREMSSRTDLKSYDFAFPAGVPGANRIAAVTGVKKSVSPFFTPMTVASWKPIADILIANGIVTKRDSHYYIIDMKRLLDAIAEEKRWKDLSKSDYAIASRSSSPRPTCASRIPPPCISHSRRTSSTATRSSRTNSRWTRCCPRPPRCSCAKAIRNRAPRVRSKTISRWSWARRRW